MYYKEACEPRLGSKLQGTELRSARARLDLSDSMLSERDVLLRAPLGCFDRCRGTAAAAAVPLAVSPGCWEVAGTRRLNSSLAAARSSNKRRDKKLPQKCIQRASSERGCRPLNRVSP